MAVIGGFRSDLSITRKTDGNFGNVSSGVFYFPKSRIKENGGKVNPGLNVIRSIIFSSLKMLFTSNVWCSLRLLQGKQYKQNTSPKSYKTEIKIALKSGFEQPGPAEL